MYGNFYDIENIIALVILVLVIISVASIIITSMKNGITPMPSSKKAVNLMIKEAEALMEDGTIVEAGSGWGILSLHLARTLPQCRIIALENSLIPYVFSRILQVIYRKQNLMLLKKNIYTFYYCNVDMIICYLYPGAMEKIKTIYCDPSLKVKYLISNTFALPDVRAMKISKAGDLYQSPVYVYSKKEK